jgi:uncharacterized membrane protein
MVLTLAGCLGLYVAYPNDHSLFPALLGVLVVSFFLYWTLRIMLAVAKQWKARGSITKK